MIQQVQTIKTAKEIFWKKSQMHVPSIIWIWAVIFHHGISMKINMDVSAITTIRKTTIIKEVRKELSRITINCMQHGSMKSVRQKKQMEAINMAIIIQNAVLTVLQNGGWMEHREVQVIDRHTTGKQSWVLSERIIRTVRYLEQVKR